jgi:hypothetical protein
MHRANIYEENIPLLIIFHDPPETTGEQDSHTGTFDAHNIIVVCSFIAYT